MWLHGAAGAGKSAIAQTIAELCCETEIVLASFFFSGSNSPRNHAKALFPTLAYQIASAVPEERYQLERVIDRDPLIFTRSLEAQMSTLIIEPLQFLVSSGYFDKVGSPPCFVIADGLDEIQEIRVQTNVIVNALRRQRIPLVFLLCSRPEQHLSFLFGSESLTSLTNRLCLDDTYQPDADIRLFLTDSRTTIKKTHPRKNLIPPSWPSPDMIDALIEKSSGQFVYVYCRKICGLPPASTTRQAGNYPWPSSCVP